MKNKLDASQKLRWKNVPQPALTSRTTYRNLRILLLGFHTTYKAPFTPLQAFATWTYFPAAIFSTSCE